MWTAAAVGARRREGPWVALEEETGSQRLCAGVVQSPQVPEDPGLTRCVQGQTD